MKKLVVALLSSLAVVYSADGDKESIEERIEFHLPSALQRCLVSFQKNSSHVCSGALVHPEIAIIIPTCEEILFHTIGIVHAVIGIVYSNRIYSSPVDKQSIKVDHKGGGALLEIFLIRLQVVDPLQELLEFPQMPLREYGSLSEAVLLGWYSDFSAKILVENILNSEYLYLNLAKDYVDKKLNDDGTLVFYNKYLVGISLGTYTENDLHIIKLADKAIHIYRKMRKFLEKPKKLYNVLYEIPFNSPLCG